MASDGPLPFEHEDLTSHQRQGARHRKANNAGANDGNINPAVQAMNSRAAARTC